MWRGLAYELLHFRRVVTMIITGMVVCFAGCVNRTTAATDPLLNSYRVYAGDLALQLMERSTLPPEQRSVSPPAPLIDSVEASLRAVASLSHPARDSVISIFSISPRLAYDAYTMFILVDSMAPWLPAWVGGRLITGEASIDTVLLPVVASVEPSQVFLTRRDGVSFKLSMRVPIDWFVLESRLQRAQAIREIGPPLLLGDGNQITIDRTGDGFRLRYSIGWGDCPAGCIHHRWWLFEVDEMGRARFLQSGSSSPGGASSSSEEWLERLGGQTRRLGRRTRIDRPALV